MHCEKKGMETEMQEGHLWYWYFFSNQAFFKFYFGQKENMIVWRCYSIILSFLWVKQNWRQLNTAFPIYKQNRLLLKLILKCSHPHMSYIMLHIRKWKEMVLSCSSVSGIRKLQLVSPQIKITYVVKILLSVKQWTTNKQKTNKKIEVAKWQ